MVSPIFFWPPGSGEARVNASATSVSNATVLSDWSSMQIWGFNGSNVASFYTASGAQNGQYGFAALCGDGVGGYSAVGYGGPLFTYAASSSGTTLHTLPSGQVYIGVAANGVNAYVISSSGNVYDRNPTLKATFPVGANLGLFNLPTSGLMLTVLPTLRAIGTFNTSTFATGSIALPAAISGVSCMATNVSGFAVGGWNTAPTLPAYGAIAPSPVNALLAVGVSGGFATPITVTSSGSVAWTAGTPVSGFSPGIARAAWIPAGTQILAVDPAAGVLQVISYTAGVLALAQTLSAPGLSDIAVAGAGGAALAPSPTTNSVMTFTAAGSTWSSGAPLYGLTAPQCVVATGPYTAAIGVSGGIAQVALVGGVWTVAATGALPFTPLRLSADAQNNVYAISASHSGAVAQINGVSVVASATLPGITTAVGVQAGQGRIIVAEQATNTLLEYSLSGGPVQTLTQTGTFAVPSGVACLALANNTLFAGCLGSTTLATLGAPGQINAVLAGAAALYNGSSWLSTALSPDNHPAAIYLDTANTMSVVTANNNVFIVPAAGGVSSSGTVASYQQAGTPLGVSTLFVSGVAGANYLFGGTSMPGVVVDTGIVPTSGATYASIIGGIAISNSSVVSGPSGTAIGTLSATAQAGYPALTGAGFAMSYNVSGYFGIASGATLELAMSGVPAGTYTPRITVSATNAAPVTLPLASINVSSPSGTTAFTGITLTPHVATQATGGVIGALTYGYTGPAPSGVTYTMTNNASGAFQVSGGANVAFLATGVASGAYSTQITVAASGGASGSFAVPITINASSGLVDGTVAGTVYGPTGVVLGYNIGAGVTYPIGSFLARANTPSNPIALVLGGTDASKFTITGGTLSSTTAYQSAQTTFSLTVTAVDQVTGSGLTPLNVTVQNPSGATISVSSNYVTTATTPGAPIPSQPSWIPWQGLAGPSAHACYVGFAAAWGAPPASSGIVTLVDPANMFTIDAENNIWTTEAAYPISSHYGVYNVTLECAGVPNLITPLRIAQATSIRQAFVSSKNLYTSTRASLANSTQFGNIFASSDTWVLSFGKSSSNNASVAIDNAGGTWLTAPIGAAGNIIAGSMVTDTGLTSTVNYSIPVGGGTLLPPTNMTNNFIPLYNDYTVGTLGTVTVSGMTGAAVFGLSVSGDNVQQRNTFTAAGTLAPLPRYAVVSSSGASGVISYTNVSNQVDALIVTADNGAGLVCQSTINISVGVRPGPTVDVGDGQTYADWVALMTAWWNTPGGFSGMPLVRLHDSSTNYVSGFSTSRLAHEYWGAPPGPYHVSGVSTINPRTVIDASWLAPNGYGQGAIMATTFDAVIEGLEIRHVSNASPFNGEPNGAGVYITSNAGGGNVTLKNTYIHDCDIGIFNGSEGTHVTIDGQCVFANNGLGNPGLTHSVYIGEVASLAVQAGCVVIHTPLGHHIKSRAANATIVGAILGSPFHEDGITTGSQIQGSTSVIEFPNFGNFLVQGNTITVGANPGNPGVINVGAEVYGANGPARVSNVGLVSGNVIQSAYPDGTQSFGSIYGVLVYGYNGAPITSPLGVASSVAVSGNSFYNVQPAYWGGPINGGGAPSVAGNLAASTWTTLTNRDPFTGATISPSPGPSGWTNGADSSYSVLGAFTVNNDLAQISIASGASGALPAVQVFDAYGIPASGTWSLFGQRSAASGAVSGVFSIVGNTPTITAQPDGLYWAQLLFHGTGTSGQVINLGTNTEGSTVGYAYPVIVGAGSIPGSGATVFTGVSLNPNSAAQATGGVIGALSYSYGGSAPSGITYTMTNNASGAFQITGGTNVSFLATGVASGGYSTQITVAALGGASGSFAVPITITASGSGPPALTTLGLGANALKPGVSGNVQNNLAYTTTAGVFAYKILLGALPSSGYAIVATGDGIPNVIVFANGTVETSMAGYPATAAGALPGSGWLGVSVNGAAVTFSYSSNGGSSFSVIGSGLAYSSYAATGTYLQFATGGNNYGEIFASEFSINGAVISAVDFSTPASGATSVADVVSGTNWTLAFGASIGAR